jgi:hypothetical protein
MLMKYQYIFGKIVGVKVSINFLMTNFNIFFPVVLLFLITSESLRSSEGLNTPIPPRQEKVSSSPRVVKHQQEQPKKIYSMGFEIETSVFKTTFCHIDPTIFSVLNSEGEKVWAFTSDTFDTQKIEPIESVEEFPSVGHNPHPPKPRSQPTIGSVPSSPKSPTAFIDITSQIDIPEDPTLYNIECKTLDGLNFEEINSAAKYIQDIFTKLKNLCSPRMNQLIGITITPNNEISLNQDRANNFLILMSDKEDFHKKLQVYPQISYCVPLEDIPAIFEHVKERDAETKLHISRLVSNKNWSSKIQTDLFNLSKNKTIYETSLLLREIEAQNVCDILKKQHEGNVKKIIEKDPSIFSFVKQTYISATRIEKSTQNILLDIFQEFKLLENSPAKGMAYLFIYYAFELFCNGNICDLYDEPGPKTYLDIMSRIPFSEMYDGLDESEKTKFREIIEEHMQDFLYIKIRKYNLSSALTDKSIADIYYHFYKDGDQKYSNILKNNSITLGMWYMSIVNVEKRIEGRDLLSPPAGMHTTAPFYAMGAYREKIEKGHVLIEIRGYSKLTYNDSKINIDNFVNFVNNESGWFFEDLAKSNRGLK